MKYFITILVVTISISTILSIEETSKENDLKVKKLVNKIECERKTKNGDYLSVHYKGSFVNGTQFDTSIGKNPYKFSLGAGQVNIKYYNLI
jgi:FK506-binding protein 2